MTGGLLEMIRTILQDWTLRKRTGQIVFEINITNGGIGRCKVREEKTLNPK